MIKSNLRWPGGKSKMIPELIQFIPESFDKYAELFCGGASFGISVIQKLEIRSVLFNDIDSDLINFYRIISNEKTCVQLINMLMEIKNKYSQDTFKNVYKEYQEKNILELEGVERAFIFFLLNKNSFSGLKNSTYSKLAFQQNFSFVSIRKLENIGKLFKNKNVIFMNKDFSQIDTENIDGYFIYLDPPYLANSKSKLYGKDGLLHKNFNHEELKLFVDKLSGKNRIMISYDNCDEVKEMYRDYNIDNFEKKYPMSNTGGNICKIGKELVIRNFQ